jgi:hypothetical protein
MLALAFALSAASIVPAPVGRAPSGCEATVKVALAFVDDSDPLAAGAVEDALSRGCIDVVEVRAGSDAAMLAAAQAEGRPWLLVARAALAQAMQDQSRGTMFSVDVTALDTSSGQRRGRAMRTANILGHAARATNTREAVRVADDAVKVLKAQMTSEPKPVTVAPPAKTECKTRSSIVLLWNKTSDAAGRAAVLRALDARCIDAPDQFENDRAGATEFARDLKRPLIAVKTSVQKPTNASAVASHVLSMNIDVVDANADELKVLKHAGDTRNALNAVDDADAWRKVEVSLVGMLLDAALPPPAAVPAANGAAAPSTTP